MHAAFKVRHMVCETLDSDLTKIPYFWSVEHILIALHHWPVQQSATINSQASSWCSLTVVFNYGLDLCHKRIKSYALLSNSIVEIMHLRWAFCHVSPEQGIKMPRALALQYWFASRFLWIHRMTCFGLLLKNLPGSLCRLAVTKCFGFLYRFRIFLVW